MTGELIVVLLILGGAIVLFASDRVRLDIVAIMVLLALLLSGVLTVVVSQHIRRFLRRKTAGAKSTQHIFDPNHADLLKHA